MQIEEARLLRVMPGMLAELQRAYVVAEVSKGCRQDIALGPVALEPPYEPFTRDWQGSAGIVSSPWTVEPTRPAGELVRWRIWRSPDQEFDWSRSELLVKALSECGHRVALEILGNQDGIAVQFLCHRDDVHIVETALAGQFEQCRLTPVAQDNEDTTRAEAWDAAALADFFPLPPYSHLLTQPGELKRSLFHAVYPALFRIPANACGLYQAVFQPVAPSHNWHRNVEHLQDLEFRSKLSGTHLAHRYLQQDPSGYLGHMAMETQTKAHNDKPFYAAALRLAVVGAGDRCPAILRSLTLAARLVQHGGRPLAFLTQDDYRRSLPASSIRQMLLEGVTYRSGFLLNSCELTTLVHIPPLSVSEGITCDVGLLEALRPDGPPAEGIPIGHCLVAGREEPVTVPADISRRHGHIIGRPVFGKSTLGEHMISHLINSGKGVAVLDPHGTLVEGLMHRIRREDVQRVIHFKPGDPEWVPIWNPLGCAQDLLRGSVSEDLVAAIRGLVQGWGDRLEHLLRSSIRGIAELPRGNLLDVSNLLRPKSEEGKRLREQVRRSVKNPLLRDFWREDIDTYPRSDIGPAHHKLSKMLISDALWLMLMQRNSSFSIKEVVDNGRVLLADLSAAGSDGRKFLGSFLLSLFHKVALARGASATLHPVPFYLFCDEAHLFAETDALEKILSENCKFGLSLWVMHQYLKQFTPAQVGALSTVGTTIVFNVDTEDARHLTKDLRGLVKPEDLITLKRGEAVVRIDTQVVRVRTPEPVTPPEDSRRDQIVALSHQHYCRPTREVEEAILRDGELWADNTTHHRTSNAGGHEPSNPEEPGNYEEF